MDYDNATMIDYDKWELYLDKCKEQDVHPTTRDYVIWLDEGGYRCSHVVQAGECIKCRLVIEED